MGLPLWTLLLAAFGLVWYFKRQSKKKELIKSKGLKEIPGPKGLPLIGSLLQLGTVPHKQFNKWTDQYGWIYEVKLGKFDNIVISDPKKCKEIFSHDPMLTGRLFAPEFSMYEDHPGLGMFNSEGNLWEVHRRFLLRQLRDFGFGKSSMEGLIMEEVEEMMNRYKKRAGKPVSEIRETLRLALVNSLWKILSNQRFEHDDPQLLKLANNTSKAFNEVLEASSLLIFMPWIKYFFPKWSGYNVVRQILEENKTLFEKTIGEHKRNFDPENLKDFIDVYLAEAKKSDPTSQFYGDLGERQLAAMLFDMFFAGSDSTAITIAWAVLYLCKYPRVQKKFQEEISQITGNNSRRVSVNDRPNMPYTLAVIDEILRFSSIVPNGVQHRAMKDTEFQGYFIPKNALVAPNLYHIHHSKQIWGYDADEFKPERFLIDGGTKYKKNENLQPFQIGRRQCVGESLARDTLFLYLTSFFQTFEMKFNPQVEEPTFESEVGFLLAPLPYSVIMTTRV